MFPGSLFFSLALANSIAVYMSIFLFLTESNFAGVSAGAQHAGLLLPLAGFMLGAYLRREAIREIVTERRPATPGDMRTAAMWLMPVVAVAAVTFGVPAFAPSAAAIDIAFVGAMAAVAVLVIATAQQVAIFLLDAGQLFEEFFQRIERLVLPVYAFLTFYSLIVVAFAAIYKIVDTAVPGPHFRMLGDDRAVSFADVRRDYAEARTIAIGRIGTRVQVVVFTWRDGSRRIISARKANPREVRFYARQAVRPDP
jgi:voltage-gated potassium channel